MLEFFIFIHVKCVLGFQLNSGTCVVLYGASLLRTGELLFDFHYTKSIQSNVKAKMHCAIFLKLVTL